jgi:hypothetical protein
MMMREMVESMEHWGDLNVNHGGVMLRLSWQLGVEEELEGGNRGDRCACSPRL